jgi:putative ABC transport system ATP-binding protein
MISAPLGDDARARLRRDHLGIVFQGFHLIPTMTAHENVALPLEFAGRCRRVRARRRRR